MDLNILHEFYFSNQKNIFGTDIILHIRKKRKI